MGTLDEPITVLHVDDDPDFLELTAEFLQAERAGLTVRTETDVKAAIDRLADGAVDCVVSDYDMPRLDGLEFLESVRERHPDLPFVLFTGKGSEEVASDAISAGVSDYLQKEPGSSQFAVLANVVENVVAKRRAETQLQQVHDRMAFALDTTDAVVFEYDDETGSEVRHGPFERLYGIADDEVTDLQRFYERAVHPDDRATLEGRQEGVIDGQADAVEVEYRTHPENGPFRWIHAAMARVPGDGDAVSIIGLATDVTARKEREAQLERQVERLDAFASIVSHDLRNPLSVARGRLELARDDIEHEDLAEAAVALDRMADLIDDLLALARYGGAVQSPGPVALAAVVEECWQTVSTERATLEIDTSAVVRADRGRLRQLLENLVRNAVEHAGPAVTIRVGDLADGFFVADDGPGIPEDRRERVFDYGHSTAPDGTGIGLAIVEQIAEAHGWSVRATAGGAGGVRLEVTGVERLELTATD